MYFEVFCLNIARTSGRREVARHITLVNERGLETWGVGEKRGILEGRLGGGGGNVLDVYKTTAPE